MRRRGWMCVLALTCATATWMVAATPAGAAANPPGVTGSEIRVGGVVGKTNPTGRPYADAFVGIKAYFDRINKQGGVFGKKLKLVAELDDQTRASKNLEAVRSLVEEKKVFAVAPVVTQTFAGAQYLVDNGIPTFGWNINAEWKKGPNLFGQRGSFLCFTCPTIAPAFIAKQVGAKKAGLLAYGGSPSSEECSKGQEAAFDKWGPPVAFVDRSLAFGFSANDISAAVQEIKDKGVDFIATCMDINGEVNFARALRQAGVTNVSFYAPEGYAPDVIEKFGDELNGIYFVIDYVPFELAKENKEMQTFLSAMKKAKIAPSEQALAGWENGALLVAGIKKAGKNFDRQKVIDAINSITDWTTNGIRPVINWPEDGHQLGHRDCNAYVQAKNGKFVPVFNEPGEPFVCFPINPWPDTLDNPEHATT